MMKSIVLLMWFGNLNLSSDESYLIAEIGLNHNGSVKLAEELIYQSFLAGATFVKFQKRFPTVLANQEFLGQPFMKAPSMGVTQLEVRLRHELSLDSYKYLFDYSRKLGLIPFATAFDLKSLDFLINDLGSEYIKIASHSATNYQLIAKAIELNSALIISLGATTANEKLILKDLLLKKQAKAVIMHCISEYPTSDNNIYLESIQALQKEFHPFPIGFSSHEKGYTASIAAVALGARFIERHITLSSESIGLDHGISMEPNEFKEMSYHIKRLAKMRGIKNEIQPAEKLVRINYHCGMYAKSDIKQGSLINIEMFDIMQPLKCENAITSLEFSSICEPVATSNITAGELLLKDMLKSSISGF